MTSLRWNGWKSTIDVFFFFLFFFLLAHFYFPASGQAVVTGVVPSPPRFLPSIFIAHRVQLCEKVRGERELAKFDANLDGGTKSWKKRSGNGKPYLKYVCVCCLHIKPFFLPNDTINQCTQWPCWFFILQRFVPVQVRLCGHRTAVIRRRIYDLQKRRQNQRGGERKTAVTTACLSWRSQRVHTCNELSWRAKNDDWEKNALYVPSS